MYDHPFVVVDPRRDFWMGFGCGVIAGFAITILAKMWGMF